jgi:casein kinase II subunit beta
VQYYEHALEMVLMPEAPDEDDLQDADFLEVYRDAQDLYGLIHARYVISPRGLEVMRELYMRGVFGTCPRVKCNSQHVLPVGTSDELRVSRVKTYCPRCEQLYATKSKYSDVDGAYFGTSFAHIFCLTFPGIIPLDPPVPYIPKLFGFRIAQPPGLIEKHLQQLEAAGKQVPGDTSPSSKKDGDGGEASLGDGEKSTQIEATGPDP